jgi:hypothetical protein
MQCLINYTVLRSFCTKTQSLSMYTINEEKIFFLVRIIGDKMQYRVHGNNKMCLL